MAISPDISHPEVPSIGTTVDFTRSVPPVPAMLSAQVAAALSELAREPGFGALLRAAQSGGRDDDRRAGARWLAPRLSVTVDEERLVVTNGTQTAILILLEALVGQGGLLLAEELSWGSLRGIAARAHVRLQGLPIDEEGLIPEAFETACRSAAPKVLYCNPTDHNPTTATMSEARRRAIVDIARRHEVAIIEDDALGRLHPAAPPPLATFAPDIVWYVMGLAKCLSHGLRLAYAVGPSVAEVERVFGPARRLSYWAPAPLSAAIATRWIAEGAAEAICAAIRDENDSRARLAVRLLAGADLVATADAMHVWLRLDRSIDRHALAAELQRRGVLVRPAELFAVDGTPPPNAVRLSLSSPPERVDVERGLAIIAATLGLPARL